MSTTAPEWKLGEVAVVAGILTLHAAMLAWAAPQHSPTLDEPAHLVAGVSHWHLGEFELYCVNPPLVRAMAALPAVIGGCRTDWSGYHSRPGGRPEFAMGSRFVQVNRPRARWLFTMARWACIPFSLIAGVCCFLWARELWGQAGAGHIALILWCCDPNVLAHGELFTPDCAAAGLGLLAGYLFWRWLKRPTWAAALFAGLGLGLAELAKMSWLILFGLWPLLWIVWLLRRPRSGHFSIWRELAQLLLVLSGALYLVNLGYGFDGTGTRLGDFTFVSRSLGGNEPGEPGNRYAGTWRADVPVPFPSPYVRGLDQQRKDLEQFPFPSYLRGEWSQEGWWYYYLYGLLVKLAHGTQFLLAAVLIAYALVKLRRPLPKQDPSATDLTLSDRLALPLADVIVLLAPAVTLLVVVSTQTGLNQHFRYVLPGFGFAFVFAGGAWFLAADGRWFGRILVTTCLAWTVLASSLNHPHNLAYFNELAGGPAAGHRHLLHSNLDWGQDLYFLPAEVSGDPPYLICYGLCDPSYFEVPAQVLHVGMGRELDFSKPMAELMTGPRRNRLRFAVSQYYWDLFEDAARELGGTIRRTGRAGKSVILCEFIPATAPG